nr:uncharacterized protein LOC116151404 isoform X7 [Camelus dromedarius]
MAAVAAPRLLSRERGPVMAPGSEEMEATAPLPPGHTGRVALPFFPILGVLSFEEGGVLSEFRRWFDWPSGSVDGRRFLHRIDARLWIRLVFSTAEGF